MDASEDSVDYPFRVVYPSQGFLEKSGFGRVAHLPFIMDNRPGYHRLANQFLIDVGLGEWSVGTRGLELASTPPPTEATMRNYAHWLTNYLEYCHARGKDPIAADYKIDLIQSYQGEMNTGSWSRDNTGLAAKTINLRVDIACIFLQWAADKGLRAPFHIPKISRAIERDSQYSSGVKATKIVQIRRGKMRLGKHRISFPPENVIGAWLASVNSRCRTEGLIVELMLETAIRRAEAAAWRIDTLPIDPADWVVVNSEKPIEHQAVRILLRYGTKGPGYGQDHGDKIGPQGDILLPMPIAIKLHDYRNKIRPQALTVALRKAKNAREAEILRKNAIHLFLDPKTGHRYSGQKIYDFWTKNSDKCLRGWSPHLARNFWACSILWKHIQSHQSLIDGLIKNKIDPSVIKTLALDIEGFIQLTIQRQLRHSSRDTTMIYLQWVSDRLGINMNFHENYAQQLIEE